MSLVCKKIIILGGAELAKYPYFFVEARKLNIQLILIELSNEYDKKSMSRILELKKKLNVNVTTRSESELIKFIINNPEIIGIFAIKENYIDVQIRLSIRFPNIHSAGQSAFMVCKNKYEQRKFLPEISPKYYYITKENMTQKTEEFFKLYTIGVVKPIDQNSSIDVIKVSNKKEHLKTINNLLDKYNKLLLEQFIEGKEYSVETIMQNKKQMFCGLTEKKTNKDCSSYFVETKHVVPARDISVQNKKQILKYNKQILEKMKFEYGITHAEYKITDDGKVYLMEVATRNAGDNIMHLYRLSYTQSLEKQILMAYLNQDSNSKQIRCISESFNVDTTDMKINKIFNNINVREFNYEDLPVEFRYSTKKKDKLKNSYDRWNSIIREVYLYQNI